MAKHPTPMLDQLESGPWPSFVSDMKALAEHRAKTASKIDYQIPVEVVDDVLGLMELTYKHGRTHWKHGGIVGVFGYGGGVIGRYCDMPEEFPGVAHFHTMRVNQPGGKFYTAKYLRELCDLWDLRGSGLTNMHGSTGDIIFLGTTTPQLEEIFFELTHEMNQDLGGSGSNLRTPADCIGEARCEFACYDTQELCYTLTNDYQDELHRPAFPYKFKFKFDGCPNCCVASIARSDMSFIGTWRDDIRIDQEAVQGYIGGEFLPNGGAHRTVTGASSTSRKKSSASARPSACGWRARPSRSTARSATAACTASTSCRARCASATTAVSPFWSAPRPPFSTAPRWARCSSPS